MQWYQVCVVIQGLTSSNVFSPASMNIYISQVAQRVIRQLRRRRYPFTNFKEDRLHAISDYFWLVADIDVCLVHAPQRLNIVEMM